MEQEAGTKLNEVQLEAIRASLVSEACKQLRAVDIEGLHLIGGDELCDKWLDFTRFFVAASIRGGS